MLTIKPIFTLLLMALASLFTYFITVTKMTTNTSEVLSSSEETWNGNPIPAYPEGKPKISILKITIGPGSTLPKHLHPVINAGVLLTGELTVEDEFGNKLKMKAGDPIIEVVNTVHFGVNSGDVPAEIIVFYAGSEGMTITKVLEETNP